MLGTVVPSIAAVPMMGYLARVLDTEKFGVLLLLYGILGFSSVFDVGITRAVIRRIAASESKEDSAKVLGTAFSIVLPLSIIAMIFLLIYSGEITKLLNISESSYSDVLNSVEIIAYTLPFFLFGITALGYLEGREEFYKLNIIRIIAGLIMAVLPAIICLFNQTLVSAVLGIFIGRVLLAFIAFYICLKSKELDKFSFCKKELRYMFQYGGWITVSNIISPLMVYGDRFVLSNIIGAKDSAYYISANEIISRMAFIPASLARTIFPMMAKKEQSTNNIEFQSYTSLLILLLVLLVPLYIYSWEVINLWLGPEYSDKTHIILDILIIGFFFNALAQIPFSKIQAKGSSKVTALLHLSELLPYFLLFYICINMFGILGAAYAWTTRVIIDFIVLVFLSIKYNIKNEN